MRAFIPRFTLAGFLLAIAGLAGLYGSITSHMRPELLQTGNLLDLCVVGNGQLIARDPGADACCGLAVRSARFHLATTGQISIRHQGKEFIVEPGICIPSDATVVSILQDGQVLYRNRGSDVDCTAGQLQLGIFPSTGLMHPLGDPQTVSPRW